MNTIYCVVVNSTYDYDEEHRIVAAFPYLEYALERMKNEWKQFLKEDWSDKMNIKEECDHICHAWQEGWWSRYHFEVYVEEVGYHE